VNRVGLAAAGLLLGALLVSCTATTEEGDSLASRVPTAVSSVSPSPAPAGTGRASPVATVSLAPSATVGPSIEVTSTSTVIPPLPTSPTPSPEPARPTGTPTPVSEAMTFRLHETLEMLSGQAARLAGTPIEVLLVEAHGPPPGCFDCPNTATLSVRSGEQVQELRYVLSGNMPPEAQERARREMAFGFVFVAVKIVEGSFTVWVEPDGA